MENKWMPTTAGILCIVAGALSLLGLLFVYLGVFVFSSIMPMTTYWDMPRWLPVLLTAIGIPGVLLDILAIIGGIFSLRRQYWGVSLAGSIAAIFSSFFLGVAALVFTIMGKNAWR